MASEPELMEEVERDFARLGPMTMDLYADDPADVAFKIKKFYLGEGKISKENHRAITRVILYQLF
jgi:hypothetical protein